VPNQHKRRPLSVRLPEDLERRLRQKAADAGVPVNAVICRAVEEHLPAAERTATAAELADESARMQRARASTPPRIR
jgi:predicted DNA-binding protein